MNGHRIVAAIAERHLTPQARAGLRALIGDTSLARISLWADEYRGRPEGRHTAPWHYVNVPDGERYGAPPSDEPRDIIQAIRLQVTVLADTERPREERAIALKFLVHFVADLHQPLHAGRAADRGGNDVAVDWFGARTNLHSVWDTRLVEHQQLSYTEFVDFLDHASPEEIAAWQHADVLDWMQESQALRDTVYAFEAATAGNAPDLRWDYANAMTPIAERRLLQAGIRLAGLLNRLLSD